MIDEQRPPELRQRRQFLETQRDDDFAAQSTAAARRRARRRHQPKYRQLLPLGAKMQREGRNNTDRFFGEVIRASVLHKELLLLSENGQTGLRNIRVMLALLMRVAVAIVGVIRARIFFTCTSRDFC